MIRCCCKLPAGRKVYDTPTLVYPTYIKYSSEQRGFGVFAATDIDPTNCKSPSACIATYGGVVCAEWEPICREEIYSLPHGYLKRKFRPSKDRYITIPTIWLFMYSSASPRSKPAAHVDGSDMYAGDGKFLNGSCNPNTEVVSDIHFHRIIGNGVTVTLPSLLFKPRRYVPFHILHVLAFFTLKAHPRWGRDLHNVREPEKGCHAPHGTSRWRIHHAGLSLWRTVLYG